MAAAPALQTLVDLRNLRAERLDPLLEEEVARWRDELRWDFRPSAELVRRFVGMQALGGHALLAGDRVTGFAYHVAEEHKGLIGDLYVAEEFRAEGGETRLLTATLDALREFPGVRRVESQLILLSPAAIDRLPYQHLSRSFLREYMSAPLDGVMRLPEAQVRARFDLWHERQQDAAAHLIAESYRNHVDADINDQYRSAAGARRFLFNIVQYPGCGSFFQPASLVSFDPETMAVTGICLASLVSFDTGHITQVCVAPGQRGTRLGYELLRRSLCSLAAAGCRRVTLTVTSSNRPAIQLYERLGFRTLRQFRALVWEWRD